MAFNRISYLFILVLLLWNCSVISQNKIVSKKETEKELKEAIRLMRKGSYDKSLVKCRTILRN